MTFNTTEGPTFDADGYPTEETLNLLQCWPYPFEGLPAFLEKAVSPYGRVDFDGETIGLATGGWSGNEAIVAVLEENRPFMMLCWQQSKRGGYHEYKLPAQSADERVDG